MEHTARMTMTGNRASTINDILLQKLECLLHRFCSSMNKPEGLARQQDPIQEKTKNSHSLQDHRLKRHRSELLMTTVDCLAPVGAEAVTNSRALQRTGGMVLMPICVSTQDSSWEPQGLVWYPPFLLKRLSGHFCSIYGIPWSHLAQMAALDIIGQAGRDHTSICEKTVSDHDKMT